MGGMCCVSIIPLVESATGHVYMPCCNFAVMHVSKQTVGKVRTPTRQGISADRLNVATISGLATCLHRSEAWR
ncbi:hypothetical protein J3E72DRAFT_358440 [Bipolaris maydis]|uniref:uncharacterized protein n=1 Tax=Cochliobolus heterostrophus TaxID=5016 RepID=UPI0024DBCAA9|nr:hypothetical protein J3E73DRAFT_349994 [Bipolaris maydis]KAJ5055785.1 hypothetical protein J3E74DRAFT_382145 [Bipolaris maydis]KAJ6192849.1 hypothetical protein J3E72DRAFT_358440 [Bipolaris maydis]KAJ6204421.1 hypothetical protein PSV09DRAFT_2351191 [Bipolaris maydis]KAJ6265673.1 hypothetical protein PSV08DRAFT_338214 [Bipolaris maydis]